MLVESSSGEEEDDEEDELANDPAAQALALEADEEEPEETKSQAAAVPPAGKTAGTRGTAGIGVPIVRGRGGVASGLHSRTAAVRVSLLASLDVTHCAAQASDWLDATFGWRPRSIQVRHACAAM